MQELEQRTEQLPKEPGIFYRYFVKAVLCVLCVFAVKTVFAV
jgi:hypothetical protein